MQQYAQHLLEFRFVDTNTVHRVYAWGVARWPAALHGVAADVIYFDDVHPGDIPAAALHGVFLPLLDMEGTKMMRVATFYYDGVEN